MTQPFEDAGKLGKEVMDTSLRSFAAVSRGAQAIAVETTEYSKKTFETGSATLEKLIAARSLENAIEIQAEYAKSFYEGLVAQTARMGELYTDLARDAYKPFESALPKAK